MLLHAMATLLDLEKDIRVVGKATDGEEALRLTEQLHPDLCVVDIEMPKISGLEVAERLNGKNHPSRVVVVTTFARPGYLQRALLAGVRGYVLKDMPISELANLLRKVYHGERVVSPELAISSLADPVNPLKEREQEILQYIAEGLSTSQIARKMFLSEGTVRNYISDLLSKLGAKNRMEAVAIAKEKGWIYL